MYTINGREGKNISLFSAEVDTLMLPLQCFTIALYFYFSLHACFVAENRAAYIGSESNKLADCRVALSALCLLNC